MKEASLWRTAVLEVLNVVYGLLDIDMKLFSYGVNFKYFRGVL
jgi:hypothetical protein